MKVVGCFRKEDGTCTPDMTAEELREAYPEKVEEMTFKLVKRLGESLYPVEITRKEE